MTLPDFALCVGIDRYPGLTTLSGAEFDATTFHAWATTDGGVAKAKLIRSSDYPNDTHVHAAQPTDRQIWDFFEEIRQAAKANNDANLGLTAGRRLYMFFSGHGFSSSIDASGVLMANAERETPHHLPARAWADRFLENGLFEEVLLFQDACRESVTDADPTPPYLKRSEAGNAKARKRFYAFAAKSPLLALEKVIDGQMRGVFSATLMEGLSGGARDPKTGEITAGDLKRYLVDNMARRLTDEERASEDISDRPEVFDLDSFVIVPAPLAAAGAHMFPVEVTLPAAGIGARILDHARKVVRSTGPNASPWRTELPLGLFEFVTESQSSHLFSVRGAIGADGKAEVVHVP